MKITRMLELMGKSTSCASHGWKGPLEPNMDRPSSKMAGQTSGNQRNLRQAPDK